MKNFYFVAVNILVFDKKGYNDIGVCFGKEKQAQDFRSHLIELQEKDNRQLPLLVQPVESREIRVVKSNDSYGFNVCETIEQGVDEINAQRHMPYSNDCQPIRDDEFRKDLHIVVDKELNRVVGMFTKIEHAEKMVLKNNGYEVQTKRDFKKKIDFRKFFFVVEKNNFSAVCFSMAQDAIEFMLHIRQEAINVPAYKDGEFILCCAENFRSLVTCEPLKIYNRVKEVIDDGDSYAFTPLYGNDVIERDTNTQVFPVVIRLNNGVEITLASFTSHYLAELYVNGLKKLNLYEANIDIIEMAESHRMMIAFKNLMNYTRTIQLADFKKDLAKIKKTKEEYLGDYDTEQMYRNMLIDFPEFYLGLTEAERGRLLEVANK